MGYFIVEYDFDLNPVLSIPFMGYLAFVILFVSLYQLFQFPLWDT